MDFALNFDTLPKNIKLVFIYFLLLLSITCIYFRISRELFSQHKFRLIFGYADSKQNTMAQ
jgi:hypothetical protein